MSLKENNTSPVVFIFLGVILGLLVTVLQDLKAMQLQLKTIQEKSATNISSTFCADSAFQLSSQPHYLLKHN